MLECLRFMIRTGLPMLLLPVVLSCATPGNIHVEALGSVSQHRTWNWLLSETSRVEVHTHGDADLEWSVARAVERALTSRGFVRDRYEPDLHVYFHVGLRRQLVKYMKTKAVQQLSSLHDSPSYLVQASEVEHHYYEIVELRIVLIDAESDQVIWRGVLDERFWEAFAPHIPEVVAELAGHIPRPSEIVEGPAPPTGIPTLEAGESLLRASPGVANREQDFVRAPMDGER